MKNYILEYSSFYKPGDIVIIEYWYNDMKTPVKILERIGRKYLISHNNEYSKIQNAPDELVMVADIIDKYKPKNGSL